MTGKTMIVFPLISPFGVHLTCFPIGWYLTELLGRGKDQKIRIGEGLTIFALLHHRAYGSVHGGSCSFT